jgi:DNA-binding NtrC family response regulator
MHKILLIDDDKAIRDSIGKFLISSGYKYILADNGINGIKIFEKELPDLVLCGLKMAKMDGLEVLKKIKEIDNCIPVIIITAFEDMDSTIRAIQLGAFDYLSKPLDKNRLKVVMTRALEGKRLNERLAAFISIDSADFKKNHEITIGRTPEIKEIFKQIGQISMNRVTVLIQGESGTGKELIAKSIHYSGVTKDHPFIPVNCSAFPETLLESEFFGYNKGAFTGAVKDTKGKFELAGEGTIFLDEISELSLEMQVKLLRVIQEREFAKLGGENQITMKARIIAATNRNLSELVKDKLFREDLYYRLNVFSINVPPLRERKEDIHHLVVHFLKNINKELHKNVRKIPYEVMEMLENHEWVGNIRELENAILQAVVLAKGEILEKEYFRLKCNDSGNNKQDGYPFSSLSMDEVEKIHIKNVLDFLNWDKNKAAEILNISKPTLYSKIEKYQLSPRVS